MKVSTFLAAVVFGTMPLFSATAVPEFVKEGHIAKSAVEKAANIGNDDAKFLLGQCYEYGLLNTSKDIHTALAYYRSSDTKSARDALKRHKIANAPKNLNNVKFAHIREDRTPDNKEKIVFYRNGKFLLRIDAKVRYLCFAEEIGADRKNNKMRLTFTPFNFAAGDFDWRTKLLDLKGDGDFRYLIIADYHTGTADGDMKGYVIDVKDNFKQIATIPVGEAFDLPYTNPRLEFKSL